MVGRGGGVYSIYRRDVLDVMHGRGRMPIDPPSHPYAAGTEHVGLCGVFTDQAAIACTRREAKREVSGESRDW